MIKRKSDGVSNFAKTGNFSERTLHSILANDTNNIHLINEEYSIVKEELMIPDPSDDSDIDMPISINIDTIKKKSTHIGTFSMYDEPSDLKEDIVLIDLSDTSENEADVSQTYESDNTNMFNKIQDILNICESPSRDRQEDDFLDISLKRSSNGELNLESDEEYMMFDFSNYSADDVLKAVENNKPIVGEKISNIDKLKDGVLKIVVKTNVVNTLDNQMSALNAGIMRNNNNNLVTSAKVIQPKTYLKINKCVNKNAIINTKESNNNTETFNSEMILYCSNCNVEKHCFDVKLDSLCNSCENKMMYQCKTCRALFASVTLMYVHLMKFRSITNESKQHEENMILDIHRNPNNLRCKKCGVQYKLQGSLARHEITCKMEPNLHCIFCSAIVTFKQQLRDHMLNSHEKLFEIEDLEKILTGIIETGNKLRDMKHLMLNYCTKCSLKTAVSEEKACCQNCGSSLIYECGRTNCSRKFASLAELSHHIHQCHFSRELLCYHCHRSFRTHKWAERHWLSCYKGNFTCKECGYVAMSKTKLDIHFREHHLICLACNKTFKRVKWLQLHKQLHCNGLHFTYKCAHCNYRTLERKKLKVHLRCCHVQVYTGRLLRCRKCGLKLGSIYRLNTHVATCSGDYTIEREKQRKSKKAN